MNGTRVGHVGLLYYLLCGPIFCSNWITIYYVVRCLTYVMLSHANGTRLGRVGLIYHLLCGSIFCSNWLSIYYVFPTYHIRVVGVHHGWIEHEKCGHGGQKPPNSLLVYSGHVGSYQPTGMPMMSPTAIIATIQCANYLSLKLFSVSFHSDQQCLLQSQRAFSS